MKHGLIHPDPFISVEMKEELRDLIHSAGAPAYQLLRKVKAHARIVWSISWAPSGQLFATGSRDNTVKLWSMGPQGDYSSYIQVL